MSMLLTSFTGRFNQISANTRGAIFIMLSMLGFVINDTMTKVSSADLGVYQVIFIRGMILSGILAVVLWRQGVSRNIFVYNGRFLWLRVVADVGGSIMFITALFNMPIANVTAIAQLTPLLITLVLGLFLGEQVGWRRYSAIAVGLIGVLIIVRPGTDGFTIYSIFALLAVVGVVGRDLFTQRVPKHVPSVYLVYHTSVMITITCGILTLLTGWDAVPFSAIALLSGAAAFVFIGYIFAVQAMRTGEASYSATFRYSVLIWAILLGIFVFGDYPDLPTLTGALIVTAAGIYTLVRGRRKLAGSHKVA